MESSNVKQEMDLDSISLHSGDYLDGIACEDQEPSADGTETVVSIADEEIGETQIGFLEKENNIIMTTEESVESSEVSSETTGMSIPSTQHVIVSSTDNLINSNTSTFDVSGPQKIITKKVFIAKGHQNVLQRPLSVSNVTSFKKPSTSLTAGKNNTIIEKDTVTPKNFPVVKSPAKILPAPGPAQSLGLKTSVVPQRILIKQNTLRSNTGQVIRIPASQMSALGIQKIQIPGTQKVQYVRIVQTSNAGSVAIKPRSLTSANTSGNPTSVYLSNVLSPAVTDTENSNNTRVKMVSLANNPTPVPTSSSTCILLPANYLTDLDVKMQPDKVDAESSSVATAGATQEISNETEHAVLQMVKLKPLAVSSEESLTSSANNADVSQNSLKLDDNSTTALESKLVQAGARTLEPNGIRPRKPCNCTKSMCLKLYCDCFANGEFCYQCNCNSCFNNIEHEDDRHHAIRQCLERNPNAFRPKIGKCLVGEGERRHTKGCNCKRSGCLKNYCECYEAKIPCSNNCKCVSCRNVEENLFLRLCQSEKTDKPMEAWKNKMAEDEDHNRQWSTKLAFSFMSETIVSATCHCLFAQADKAKKSDIEEEELQKIILEECGNCLQQIIVIAGKSLSQKSQSSS